MRGKMIAILSWLKVSSWAVMPIVIYLTLSGTCCPPCGSPGPPVPSNFDGDYRLIFPQTAGTSPTIDGLVSDEAWTGAFTYYFERTDDAPVGFMEGIADANYLYMYFEVTENSFNSSDVMVIGINPSSSSDDYRRLHIYPFVTGGAPADTSDLPPHRVEYCTGVFDASSTSYTWTSAPVPDSITVRVATATGGTDEEPILKWAVELRIPIGAPFNIPHDNYFGLYVNVATTDAYYGTAVQYTWPRNRIIGSDDPDIFSEVERGTPHPDLWGNASRTTRVGNGVYITCGDLRTNNVNTGEISLNGDNLFYATAHNNTTISGTFTAAQDVSATFKIANFGLPGLGSWANVPTGGPGVTGTVLTNPAGPEDIPATGSMTYSIGPWRLSQAERDDYSTHLHQCIRVDLSSTDPTTTFVNSSVQRNMDFVSTASPFEREARISTAGYELPPHKEAQEFILTGYGYNTDVKAGWKSGIKGATQAVPRRYVVSVPQGREMDIRTIVTPPSVKIPSTYWDIVPGKDSLGFVRLPVKPDNLVTLIADGSIEIATGEGNPIVAGPNGRDLRQFSTGESKIDTSEKYLLSGKQSPQRVVGALIGSWDGFKESSFLVGQAATFKVPRGAEVLYLALNLPRSGKMNIGGKGFHIQEVQTPLKDYYVFANPVLTRDPTKEYVSIPLGANLPTWIIRGTRNTGKIVTIEGKKFNVYEPIGAFGYIVKDIGR